MTVNSIQPLASNRGRLRSDPHIRERASRRERPMPAREIQVLLSVNSPAALPADARALEDGPIRVGASVLWRRKADL